MNEIEKLSVGLENLEKNITRAKGKILLIY